MYFDQYTDTDETFMKKVASIPRLEDVDSLPDKDFAIIITGKQAHRQFPLKDRRSALLSLLYFVKNLKRMPPEYIQVAGPRIKEALVRFNMHVPDALAGFPIGCEDYEVEKVATNVPTVNKVAKAAKIIKRLTNDNIERDVDYFVRNLEQDQKEPYVKLAGMVKAGEVSPEMACEAFEALNEQNHINQYKRRYSPDELVYGVEKTANFFFAKEAEMSVEEALNSESAEQIKRGLKEHLDEEVVEGLFENPDVVFNSLPKPHQDVIRSVIDQEV